MACNCFSGTAPQFFFVLFSQKLPLLWTTTISSIIFSVWPVHSLYRYRWKPYQNAVQLLNFFQRCHQNALLQILIEPVFFGFSQTANSLFPYPPPFFFCGGYPWCCMMSLVCSFVLLSFCLFNVIIYPDITVMIDSVLKNYSIYHVPLAKRPAQYVPHAWLSSECLEHSVNWQSSL